MDFKEILQISLTAFAKKKLIILLKRVLVFEGLFSFFFLSSLAPIGSSVNDLTPKIMQSLLVHNLL